MSLHWTTLAPGYRTTALGPLSVTVSEEDGYINATKLCQGGGKRLENWSQTKTSQAVYKAAAEITGLPVEDLCRRVNSGPRPTWGSYLHPLLITNMAYWISPEFGIKVCHWIEEWKKLDGNEERYYEALANLIPCYHSGEEDAVQEMLADRFRFQREVNCTHGRIDLLSDHYLIEVKRCRDWMKGVGQLVCYGKDYPQQVRILYTYDGTLSLEEQSTLLHTDIIPVSSVREMEKITEKKRGLEYARKVYSRLSSPSN